jgi:hypothetical protein
MALLTMRSKRQPVATGRNGFTLVQAVFGPPAAKRLPLVAPPLFHTCSIAIGPKRAVSSPVTPDCALGTVRSRTHVHRYWG